MAILPATKTTRARTSKSRFAGIQKIRLKTLLALCLWLKLKKKMKSKIFKLYPVVLLFLFMGASCQNDDIEYADESIVVYNNPGFHVYKTKANYFDKVWVEVTSDGKLNKVLIIDEKNIHLNYIEDKNKELQPTYRHLLKSGYIVGDASRKAQYTDITFTEYYDYNKENKVNSWPDELIWPRIVDEDPYEELYWMGCLNCKMQKFTLGEINDIIENGTLETTFTKIK